MFLLSPTFPLFLSIFIYKSLSQCVFENNWFFNFNLYPYDLVHKQASNNVFVMNVYHLSFGNRGFPFLFFSWHYMQVIAKEDLLFQWLQNVPTEKALVTHSSTLAWNIPWTEEPERLQSMGSLRVGHDWVTSLSLFTFMHWRRKWQPTPVFLPGESQGQRSLAGCRLWGRTVRHNWSDLAAAAAGLCGLENFSSTYLFFY